MMALRQLANDSAIWKGRADLLAVKTNGQEISLRRRVRAIDLESCWRGAWWPASSRDGGEAICPRLLVQRLGYDATVRRRCSPPALRRRGDVRPAIGSVLVGTPGRDGLAQQDLAHGKLVAHRLPEAP
jgi:hypothetical protein